MKKHLHSRLFAILLVVTMLAGIFATTALAADDAPALTAGENLSEYFPDDVFRAWVITTVLKDTSGETDIELTSEHIDAITDYSKELNLYNKGVEDITGIGYLVNLTGANFGYNNITEIPEEIGNLTNMKSLNFFMNNISSIPEDCIGNMTNLWNLSFAFNAISEVPEDIFTLENLTNLALANNQISSVDGIEKLGKLTSFTIANNLVNDISGIQNNLSMRQASGQLRYESSITVAQGATEAVIDLNDYAFSYSGLNGEGNMAPVSTFRYYPETPGVYETSIQTDPDFVGKGYHHYVEPANLASYAAVAQVIDKTAEENLVTVTFAADAEYFTLRFGNAEPADLPSADKQWTSFWNFDITYIIPIERKEAPSTGSTSYKLTVNHVLVEEDGTRTTIDTSTSSKRAGASYSTSNNEYDSYTYTGLDADSAPASGTIRGNTVVTYLYAPVSETIDIEPEETPLSEFPIENEDADDIIIVDENVPLGDLPHTGANGKQVDPAMTLGILALVLSLALVGMNFLGKKKREEA